MLKCKVNTREFQDAITKLEVVIPSRTALGILKTIKLSATDDSIQLAATDLENHVTANIYDFQVESQGSILITNIKDIIKSFKFMKENYTEIEVKKDEVIISNGNRNIKMKCESSEDFPKEFEIADIDNNYIYNTKSLHNRIKKIDYARAKNNTRPVLAGIHFNNADIVALDGFRIALNKDNTLTVVNPFTLTQSTVNFLTKTLNKNIEKELKIAVNDKHIVFEYDDLIVKSRLIADKFFNYKDILPKEYKNFTIDTKNLKENAEFLNVYTKGTKMELLKINITSDKLELQANTEKGIFNAINDINSEAELTTGLNNGYLLDALKVVDGKEIEIRFNGSINPIVITDREGSEHLILPIRLAA